MKRLVLRCLPPTGSFMLDHAIGCWVFHRYLSSVRKFALLTMAPSIASQTWKYTESSMMPSDPPANPCVGRRYLKEESPSRWFCKPFF
ncbi:hypothetical protein K402DRAFT_37688 [Aulographum hederae CBS 113979]|uniref:Uncharacterized protein n=1 Tax=Aulographum hederae CBS 113979 TaxID=1176131 RepID=A0A6G1H4H0_9PEZI|nr:hypothetical protein K402DRAFT_37688 [Aulographum hederae CBS 113979]